MTTLVVVSCSLASVLPAAPAVAGAVGAGAGALGAGAVGAGAVGAGAVGAGAEAAGTWVWPLSPRPVIVARFDPPDSPWGAGHRGVDLLGAEGQPVLAAGAGVVRYAGLLAGRGVVTVTQEKEAK